MLRKWIWQLVIALYIVLLLSLNCGAIEPPPQPEDFLTKFDYLKAVHDYYALVGRARYVDFNFICGL